MSNAELLPSLLFKINENQLALEATIMDGHTLAADSVRPLRGVLVPRKRYLRVRFTV
jgi:hypothetical protein